MQRSNTVILDLNREWIRLQIAKPFAQVIADHPIYHKYAVRVHGCGENFTARQIAPLVACNNAAGFEPFKFRRKLGNEFGAMRRFASDALDLTRMFDQTLA